MGLKQHLVSWLQETDTEYENVQGMMARIYLSGRRDAIKHVLALLEENGGEEAKTILLPNPGVPGCLSPGMIPK